ncbi:hypothetical protein HK097_007773 [Rhizophlyctis rosea]|uniref:DNA polymerase kappa n=1 Tax=Rhizophlyctis rosea TaxID=64517 RepID=A0AAD5SD57_9FUNG|nr:hypothetical protein HK097_007773 [Rhizophlyctis rosea]
MASVQGPTEAELEAEWEEDDVFLDEDGADLAVEPDIVAGTQLPVTPAEFSNLPTTPTTSSSSIEQETVNGKESEDSLKARLLINPNKAGTDGVDREKINKVIYETSKGSPFFLNEQRRDEATTQRILQIMQKVEALRGTDLSFEKKVVEEKLKTFEATRDLSHWIVHVDMDGRVMLLAASWDPPTLTSPSSILCFSGRAGSARTEGQADGGWGNWHVNDGKLSCQVGLICIGPIYDMNFHNISVRKFGVRSAMPGYIALKLCPELVLVPLNFEKYTAYSKRIREVFAIYDPNFSPMSLDEAYLDLTEYLRAHPDRTPEDIVQEIRAEIESRTKLTASAGIAANKMLAKVCSDVNKPNGQKLIPQDREAIISYMSTLPIRKVPGIGRVTERILKALGVDVCGDLGKYLVILYKLFSPIMFEFLARVSLGLGSVEVESEWDRKSMGCERTFSAISDPTRLYDKLYEIAVHLAGDLDREKLKGQTITLKVKGWDFRVYSRAKRLSRMVWKAEDLFNYGKQILAREIAASERGLKLRLMGLRMTSLSSREVGDEGIVKFLKRSNPDAEDGKADGGEEGVVCVYRRLTESHHIPKLTTMTKESNKRTRLSESERESSTCPVCGKELPGMSARMINLHVDRCLEPKEEQEEKDEGGERVSSPGKLKDTGRGKRKSSLRSGAAAGGGRNGKVKEIPSWAVCVSVPLIRTQSLDGLKPRFSVYSHLSCGAE